MKLTVFLGPTLEAMMAHELLDKEPDVEVLPPAKQGDLYLATERGAEVLGLVDGYFDQVESVAHKEVLWAMSKGVHVFGASSMGALRAAELSMFGMEGVGEIFEQFQRGDLTDDDEVAVAHASAEYGYRCTSEAMVDIRATMARARDAGILGNDTYACLLRAAKQLFYPDRAYPLILARAEAAGANRDELSAFAAFVPAGRVQQKRLDAIMLLDKLRALRAAPVVPKQVRYFFNHTDAWEAIRRRAVAH